MNRTQCFACSRFIGSCRYWGFARKETAPHRGSERPVNVTVTYWLCRVLLRTQRRAMRGMLADLKMTGSLEAVDGILS